MLLYEKLVNSEYHKNILNDFINDVYKNNSDKVKEFIFNIQNKLNTTSSGSLISLEPYVQNNPILQRVLKRLNISLDYKQIAGNVLETIVVEYINECFKESNIVRWPNGEMYFPDFSVNSIPIDVKAVFVPEMSSDNYKFDKHGKPKTMGFNNAIESSQEVIKKLNSFFNNEPNYNDIGNAFILYVYYSCSDNGITILKCQIVPLITCILYNKNNLSFTVKSGGTLDENGNKEVKNSNVCIRMKLSDNRTLDEIYNDLKLIIVSKIY